MKRFIILCLLLLPTAAPAFNLGFDLGGDQRQAWIDVIPELSWSPTSHDYGTKDTGTNTDFVFTLANTGNEVAEEVSLAVSGAGYSLLSTNCGVNPFNLAYSTDCIATVRFTPASAGTLNGSLTATWPNRDPVVASLTGVGVSASYFADFNSGTEPAGWSHSGASIAYNFTPALEGAYSLSIPSGVSQYVLTTFPASDTKYLTARIKLPSAVTSSTPGMWYICSDSACSTVLGKIGVDTSNQLLVLAQGGSQTPGGSLPVNEMKYIKIRQVKGTGVNASTTTWLSDDGLAWTLAAQSTNGTTTGQPLSFAINGTYGSAVILDTIKESNSDITDAR